MPTLGIQPPAKQAPRPIAMAGAQVNGTAQGIVGAPMQPGQVGAPHIPVASQVQNPQAEQPIPLTGAQMQEALSNLLGGLAVCARSPPPPYKSQSVLDFELSTLNKINKIPKPSYNDLGIGEQLLSLCMLVLEQGEPHDRLVFWRITGQEVTRTIAIWSSTVADVLNRMIRGMEAFKFRPGEEDKLKREVQGLAEIANALPYFYSMMQKRLLHHCSTTASAHYLGNNQDTFQRMKRAELLAAEESSYMGKIYAEVLHGVNLSTSLEVASNRTRITQTIATLTGNKKYYDTQTALINKEVKELGEKVAALEKELAKHNKPIQAPAIPNQGVDADGYPMWDDGAGDPFGQQDILVAAGRDDVLSPHCVAKPFCFSYAFPNCHGTQCDDEVEAWSVEHCVKMSLAAFLDLELWMQALRTAGPETIHRILSSMDDTLFPDQATLDLWRKDYKLALYQDAYEQKCAQHSELNWYLAELQEKTINVIHEDEQIGTGTNPMVPRSYVYKGLGENRLGRQLTEMAKSNSYLLKKTKIRRQYEKFLADANTLAGTIWRPPPKEKSALKYQLISDKLSVSYKTDEKLPLEEIQSILLLADTLEMDTNQEMNSLDSSVTDGSIQPEDSSSQSGNRCNIEQIYAMPGGQNFQPEFGLHKMLTGQMNLRPATWSQVGAPRAPSPIVPAAPVMAAPQGPVPRHFFRPQGQRRASRSGSSDRRGGRPNPGYRNSTYAAAATSTPTRPNRVLQSKIREMFGAGRQYKDVSGQYGTPFSLNSLLAMVPLFTPDQSKYEAPISMPQQGDNTSARQKPTDYPYATFEAITHLTDPDILCRMMAEDQMPTISAADLINKDAFYCASMGDQSALWAETIMHETSKKAAPFGWPIMAGCSGFGKGAESMRWKEAQELIPEFITPLEAVVILRFQNDFADALAWVRAGLPEADRAKMCRKLAIEYLELVRRVRERTPTACILLCVGGGVSDYLERHKDDGGEPLAAELFWHINELKKQYKGKPEASFIPFNVTESVCKFARNQADTPPRFSDALRPFVDGQEICKRGSNLIWTEILRMCYFALIRRDQGFPHGF